MTRSDTSSMQLAKTMLIRLADTTREIRCDAGSLWITLDGDPRDIVLEPGQHFVRAGCAGTLVYALEPSRLTLHHTSAAPCIGRAPRRALPRQVLAME
ncbi:DUF2917 domain-containing protein [Comamonadaceae bacterium G21597-S1]|nr:DUF2917 domain-containing protein [Comamonadaceae bacterium G21597-S1]